jgi:hypothetical protein
MTFEMLSSPAVRARAAGAAMLVLVAGIGYALHSSRPAYTESAIVEFLAPPSLSTPREYELYAPSLIATGATITQLLQAPGSRRAIRAAGGTGTYQIGLINLYNQDYPDYANPIATLSASASDRAVARRTYQAAEGELLQLLTQTQQPVRPDRRIIMVVTSDTGAVRQAGSAKRVYGGLLLLGLVMAGLARGFVLRRAGGSAVMYHPLRVRRHRARRPLLSRL